MNTYNSFNELATANAAPLRSDMSVFNAKHVENEDEDSTPLPCVIKMDKGEPVLFFTLMPEKMTWEEAKEKLRDGYIIRRKGHSDRFQVDEEGRIVVLGSNMNHVTKFTLQDFDAEDWVACGS